MPRESLSPISQKIKELRIERGWNQSQFGEKLENQVSDRTLQRAEAGKPVSVSSLTKIAQALGVPMSTITESSDPIKELDDNNAIVTLVGGFSGRDLVKALPESAEDIEFIFNVNPQTLKEAEPYEDMVRLLEALPAGRYSEEESRAFPIMAAAKFNEAKAAIEGVNGSVLGGSYIFREYEEGLLNDQVHGILISHTQKLILQFEDTPAKSSQELIRNVGRNSTAHRNYLTELLWLETPVISDDPSDQDRIRYGL